MKNIYKYNCYEFLLDSTKNRLYLKDKNKDIMIFKNVDFVSISSIKKNYDTNSQIRDVNCKFRFG